MAARLQEIWERDIGVLHIDADLSFTRKRLGSICDSDGRGPPKVAMTAGRILFIFRFVERVGSAGRPSRAVADHITKGRDAGANPGQ